MAVIQHENHGRVARDELVDEGRHDVALDIRTRGIEAPQYGRAGPDGLSGSEDDIAPEPLRIIIAGVNGDPAGGDRVPAQPVADQRALAPPRRGLDQGERYVESAE